MNVADAAKLDFATKFNFGISSSAHTKFWRMKLRCRSCSLGIPRLKILDIEVYFEFIYCFSNVQYAFALLLSFIYNQWGVNEVFFLGQKRSLVNGLFRRPNEPQFPMNWNWEPFTTFPFSKRHLNFSIVVLTYLSRYFTKGK